MDKIFEYEWSKKQLLGKGSYSNVYKGVYNGSNNQFIERETDVAVKIINIKNLNRKGIDVINEEIRIMKMIKKEPHPNIVGCYDVFQDNEYVYIILEYCDSGNLRNILKKPLREKYAQYYFCQLTEGLKYLDEHNIIHRDIKPRNILLTKNRMYLKIADFGFAKSTNGISLYDTICGSPLYMAPEIMGYKVYNNQSDLWSIGMILFEMLYGYHPLNNCNSLSDIKYTIENREILIPPINNTNKEVSNECITLLSNLLQRDASKRINWIDFFTYLWNNPKGKRISSSPNLIASFSQTISSDQDDDEQKYHSKILNCDFEIVDNYIDNMNDQMFQMES